MTRLPIWTIQLAAMILSAAIVVAVGWFLLAALLSLREYVPSEVLR